MSSRITKDLSWGGLEHPSALPDLIPDNKRLYGTRNPDRGCVQTVAHRYLQEARNTFNDSHPFWLRDSKKVARDAGELQIKEGWELERLLGNLWNRR